MEVLSLASCGDMADPDDPFTARVDYTLADRLLADPATSHQAGFAPERERSDPNPHWSALTQPSTWDRGR